MVTATEVESTIKRVAYDILEGELQDVRRKLSRHQYAHTRHSDDGGAESGAEIAIESLAEAIAAIESAFKALSRVSEPRELVRETQTELHVVRDILGRDGTAQFVRERLGDDAAISFVRRVLEEADRESSAKLRRLWAGFRTENDAEAKTLTPPPQDGNVTLAQMAELCGLSTSTLSKTHHKETRPAPSVEQEGRPSLYRYLLLKQWIEGKWGSRVRQLPESFTDAMAILREIERQP